MKKVVKTLLVSAVVAATPGVEQTVQAAVSENTLAVSQEDSSTVVEANTEQSSQTEIDEASKEQVEPAATSDSAEGDMSVNAAQEETGEFILYNSGNLHLYNSASSSAKRADVIAPQTLFASKKLGSWYAIQTWLGEKWIYNQDGVITERKVETLPAGSKVQAVQVFYAHTYPFDRYKGNAYAPQTVTAYKKAGNWYEIKTWEGKRWIYVNAGSVAAEPDAGSVQTISATQLTFHTTAYFYTKPSYSYKTKDAMGPQAVQSTRKLGNWYEIDTYVGKRWVDGSKAASIKAVNEPDLSQVQDIPPTLLSYDAVAYFYTKPSESYKTKAAMGPQTVKSTRKLGNWYEIDTYLGKRWVDGSKAASIKVVDEPDLSQVQDIPLTLLSYSAVAYFYTKPSESYKTKDAMGPQTVKSTRRLGDWYEIDTYLGKRWVNGKQASNIVIVEEPDLSEAETLGKVYVYTGSSLYLHDKPSEFYKTSDTVTKKLLVAVRRLGDWYEVNTQSGKKWMNVSLSSASYISSKANASSGIIPLTETLELHNGPFDVMKTGQFVGAQNVKTLETVNGWIKIQTWLGAKWIKDVNGITGTASTYEYVTASGTQTTNDYPTAYAAYANSQVDSYLVQDGKVIDMKQGFVRVNLPSSMSILVFTDIHNGKTLTYVSNKTDLGFVRTAGDKVHVTYEGETAAVSKQYVELIPALKKAKTSYFKRSGDVLYRYYYNPSTDSYYKGLLGYAPSGLVDGRAYYSFDSTHVGGVETYQYFKYMPLRIQSSYTAAELDEFMRVNYPQIYQDKYGDNVLYGKADIFIKVAKKYNLNAAYFLAHAIHESGWGTSAIARDKNNFFGYGAYDSDAYQSAKSFATLEEGLEACAKFINDGYMNPSDWRYEGAFVGEKARGMNVRYASDPDWGSKIAAYMHRIDKMYGNRDLNQYPIGLVEPGVTQYSYANEALQSVGKLPVQITVAIVGQATIGNTKYYKVIWDKQTTGSSSLNTVYIPVSSVKTIKTY